MAELAFELVVFGLIPVVFGVVVGLIAISGGAKFKWVDGNAAGVVAAAWICGCRPALLNGIVVKFLLFTLSLSEIFGVIVCCA